MFAAGVVEEVRQIDTMGQTAEGTLGWKEIRAHIDGSISREKCVGLIQNSTRQYAKRQLTWFRRRSDWEWITLEGDGIPPGLVDDLARRAGV